MENEELQERIRAHLASELSPEESEKLLREIQEQEGSMEEFTFNQRLTKVLRNREALEVHQLIKNAADQEANMSSPAPRGWTNYLFSIGLALFGLLLVGGFFIGRELGWFESPLDRQVESYLEPLENTNFAENTGMELDDLRLGMEAYESKDYLTAIERLGRHYERTNESNVGLYLGISLLFEARLQEAKTILKKVSDNLEAPLSDAADWYLALAHLKAGEKEAAIPLLQELISSQSLYVERAQALINQMN